MIFCIEEIHHICGQEFIDVASVSFVVKKSNFFNIYIYIYINLRYFTINHILLSILASFDVLFKLCRSYTVRWICQTAKQKRTREATRVHMA
jgi:hypothetical protein